VPSSREKATAAERLRRQQLRAQAPDFVRLVDREQKKAQRARKRAGTHAYRPIGFRDVPAADRPLVGAVTADYEREAASRRRFDAILEKQSEPLDDSGDGRTRGELLAATAGDVWGTDDQDGLPDEDDDGLAVARLMDVQADVNAQASRKGPNWSWTKKRGLGDGSRRAVAPVFDAFGDGIHPTTPARTVRELAARKEFKQLSNESDAVDAVCLKINNLGQRALDSAFTVDEQIVIQNLMKRKRPLVGAAQALDLPNVPWLSDHVRRNQIRYHLIPYYPKRRSEDDPHDDRED
jgi:hypothetical protein